jgi:hypothetical protein
MDNLEQQRVIGELTNQVMSTLPAEERKGYLLSPRSVLTLEGMMQAILEADGITQEMLEAQRQRAELLDRLVGTQTAEERRAIVKERTDLIDLDFFELLELNVEAAHANDRQDLAEALLGLRSQLLDWTPVGHDLAVREEALRELGSEVSRENLLEKLIEAATLGQEVKVKTMVTFARPAIDYLFYQQLTGQIDAAQAVSDEARARVLHDLRDTVLDLTTQIDAELQQATEEASSLVQHILHSTDMEAALRANARQIDELFMNALALNLQAAEQAGRNDEAERLRRIAELTVQLLEESQPPELQLVNRLLRAEYPQDTMALLESNRDSITPQFLEMMRMVATDLAESGRERLAEQLRLVQEQAAAVLQKPETATSTP